MDTPQVTPELLDECARALLGDPVVLGMAARRRLVGARSDSPAMADCLHAVPMSRADTGTVTLAALRDNGLAVTLVPELPTWTPSTTWRSSVPHAHRTAGSSHAIKAAGL